MLLRCTSLQADSALFFYRGVADYLGAQLGAAVEFDDRPDWRARQERLDAGACDLAFVCGYNYTSRVDAGRRHLALAAAPVPAGPRYDDRPVYFSDVVVRADSRFDDVAALRGRRWAFNEPCSHSGYRLTLFELARRGAGSGYFSQAVEAGSHQRSLDLVLAGEVDGAAIDSYVLELERAARPELSERLRVVATFGPSPSPPVVVRASLDEAVQERIAAALAGMDADERGREILAAGRVRRFQRVVDADYDPIREMARAGEGLSL